MSLTPKYFSGSPLFEIYKVWVPPFRKGETHYNVIVVIFHSYDRQKLKTPKGIGMQMKQIPILNRKKRKVAIIGFDISPDYQFAFR